MVDPRLTKLADLLVNYSTTVQPGENVLVEAIGIDSILVTEIVKAVHKAGGHPYVTIRDPKITRALLLGATEEQMNTWAEFDTHTMNQMQAYIAVRGGDNVYEMSDVPADNLQLYQALYSHKVHSENRVKNTKWVILRYPSSAMAQLAGKSTEEFENFYFDVCTLDYRKMEKAMDPLEELMKKTDKVHIVGPGTDLTFSIKNIGAVKCCGKRNIPDGEVYSAPVRDSINGVLSYNTPSPYQGFTFENVKLTFEQGKIIKAESNDIERINKIFDTDEGARYIGEFAIGIHPFIQEPMKDTLFDEKIEGSFHFTPGQCYDAAYNGNKSAIHWDMVCIQRPEYGGGEIWFDDRLIRKDGRFIVPELEGLNPENLK
ncbi:MAG: aminopeptidase [Gorillibacterium sp.]|nr:aminopeptidase [Gorillibacterium sp.]